MNNMNSMNQMNGMNMNMNMNMSMNMNMGMHGMNSVNSMNGINMGNNMGNGNVQRNHRVGVKSIEVYDYLKTEPSLEKMMKDSEEWSHCKVYIRSGLLHFLFFLFCFAFVFIFFCRGCLMHFVRIVLCRMHCDKNAPMHDRARIMKTFFHILFFLVMFLFSVFLAFF